MHVRDFVSEKLSSLPPTECWARARFTRPYTPHPPSFLEFVTQMVVVLDVIHSSFEYSGVFDDFSACFFYYYLFPFSLSSHFVSWMLFVRS